MFGQRRFVLKGKGLAHLNKVYVAPVSSDGGGGASQEYMDALKTATEAHKLYAETRNKLANDETPFFSSQYVRWTLRAILFSVWLISICLTCIIAHDNAKLHTIQKKYVLLREFARPNQEWADKADYIEFLYADEAEHQAEIQRLWEIRRKRLKHR